MKEIMSQRILVVVIVGGNRRTQGAVANEDLHVVQSNVPTRTRNSIGMLVLIQEIHKLLAKTHTHTHTHTQAGWLAELCYRLLLTNFFIAQTAQMIYINS